MRWGKEGGVATILLVDDERLTVELLRKIITKHGHTVLTATKGEEGLQLFREHRPHLTVLDLNMPGISGIELLAQIREVDSNASVMALTGHASDEQQREALRLGVSAVIRKSAGIELVEEMVLSKLEKKGQILVVDDEPTLCSMLAKRLSMQGFDVRTANTGAQALASIEKSRPRLMLLDMYMPEMSGIEVIRTLRGRGDMLPIVVVTASRDQALLDECLKLGSFDVISKPVDLDYLDMAILVSLTMA
jgi:CheY-like chemotaxis protein